MEMGLRIQTDPEAGSSSNKTDVNSTSRKGTCEPLSLSLSRITSSHILSFP